jgi:hypothetical protein
MRDVLFINLHAPWYFTLTFVPRRGSKGKGKGRGYNSLFKKKVPLKFPLLRRRIEGLNILCEQDDNGQISLAQGTEPTPRACHRERLEGARRSRPLAGKIGSYGSLSRLYI